MDAKQIKVSGLVQGVGFRPFVFNLATQHNLNGWVCNTSSGVEIAIEGDDQPLARFIQQLQSEAPPLAHIDSIQINSISTNGFTDFTIRSSVTQPAAFQPVSPDMALCADCERELFDPTNRRYLYPFINCTNCGPRFSIIRDLPYDRPATTMANFKMCAECEQEYAEPHDRRFHAQPNACETCGPKLEIKDQRSNLGSVLMTRRLLREGKIVAIKGIGGFHLACDAMNTQAVNDLRQRKGRVDKPFAVMVADLETIETLCEINDEERLLLTSHEKPIVLLQIGTIPATSNQQLATNIAPNLNTLGVMLPYTPLHHLLLNQTDPTLNAEPTPKILVMTSGNYSEEPIATQNDEALQHLAPLADAFLLHNRDIHQRCDDSVVKVIKHQHCSLITDHSLLFLRRSRGYAPFPVRLPFTSPHILAVGGELKNTFCLARDRYAFLSQHIGDMENIETLTSFEQSLDLLSRLFRVEPTLIAHDLHPDYLSTRYALRNSAPKLAIQHHHAHIAACMADNGLDNEPVIGLAFDGTGYGSDGAIWGGEFLIANYSGYKRVAHLEYLPLAGGDVATREVWRLAFAYCFSLGIEVDDLECIHDLDKQTREIVTKQIEKKINTPLTSSMGRLFDAVAVLAGGRQHASYEAQAAIELEAAAKKISGDKYLYPYHWEQIGDEKILHLRELLSAVVYDARHGESFALIANRFHRALASFIVEVCLEIKDETGIDRVALSGGVWQNELLLKLVSAPLVAGDITVYTHHQVPTNDGGLSLGQVAIAAHH